MSETYRNWFNIDKQMKPENCVVLFSVAGHFCFAILARRRQDARLLYRIFFPGDTKSSFRRKLMLFVLKTKSANTQPLVRVVEQSSKLKQPRVDDEALSTTSLEKRGKTQ